MDKKIDTLIEADFIEVVEQVKKDQDELKALGQWLRR